MTPPTLDIQAWAAKLAKQRNATTEHHLRACIMALEGYLPPDSYIAENMRAVIGIPAYPDSTVYFYKEIPLVRTAPINTSKKGKITDTIWVANLKKLREINKGKI